MIQDIQQYPSLSTFTQTPNPNSQSEKNDIKSNVPSTIDKADPEKAGSFNSQTDFKLKFNTSYDNLKCFINCEKTERRNPSSTRLVKQSKSAVQLPTSFYGIWQQGQTKISERQSFQDQRPNITKSQSIKEEQNENDVSKVLSNQILHHIQLQGIYCKWTEIQQVKSQSMQSQNLDDYLSINELFHTFSDKKLRCQYEFNTKPLLNQNFNQKGMNQNGHTLNNRNGDFMQNFYNYPPQSEFNKFQNYEKNYSFASTMDPYSNVFPNSSSPELFTGIQHQQNMSVQMGYIINYDNNQLMIGPYDDYTIIPDYLQHDLRTTIMIKNIPNKYTIHYLSQEIDKQFGNYYDFLYLPCDIKSGANQGYGFINFVDKDAIRRFYSKFHGKKWRRFRSQKICNLTYGRLQGINSLIDHFQNSKVLNHKEKKYQPIIKKLPEIHHLIKKQQDMELQDK